MSSAAGGRSPARATRCRRSARATSATSTSPSTSPRPTPCPGTIERLHNILGGEALHALVNNAGFSPKGEGGSRLGCLDGDLGVWERDLRDQLLRPGLLQPRLRTLARRNRRLDRQHHLDRRQPGPSFCRQRLQHVQGGADALTRELAADLAHLGIRANAVCPGEINTAILSPGTEEIVERIPLKRLGSPREVAAAIFYLCSEEASYITGAEIPVNGGQDVH